MYYIFLGCFGEGGDVTIAMLVSSSAVLHCLPSLLGSAISAGLQAQSHDFTVNSGNQILMEFLPLLEVPQIIHFSHYNHFIISLSVFDISPFKIFSSYLSH